MNDHLYAYTDQELDDLARAIAAEQDRRRSMAARTYTDEVIARSRARLARRLAAIQAGQR